MFGPSGRLPSAVQHNFSQVPQADIPRSQFDRSHGYKTTFDSGYLVPVFVDEALPGDTFRVSMSCFGRLATPLVPVMDNLYLDSFFFAVPIRLIWDNFKKMCGEQVDPGDSTTYLAPVMTAPAVTGHVVGSLSDYFGIPTGIASLSHSSLWHRAYNLIWNEWFRDENLQDSLVVDKDDGPDTSTDYVLKRRGKRHDYFTSCLPWPQKGTAVSMPLGTSAEVRINSLVGAEIGIHDSAGGVGRIKPSSADNNVWEAVAPSGGTAYLYSDLSGATAATINQLREAFQVQRLLERDARGGTRYTEIVRAHFGVVSPDARLQRPEFLGGGSTPINVHPIAQTSATAVGTTPQGHLAAMGTLSASGHGFTKSFTEHCVLIGMVCVRADLNYQQGLNRMFSRRDRYDFYWPALAHIGEQAVLNKEIYAQNDANDDLVFGYQERYAEYRYKPSVITGQFRSTFATPLDMYHLAQEYSVLPQLDDTFIEENPPVDRVVADADDPEFLFDAHFNCITARPMPTYSVPGLIDHF